MEVQLEEVRSSRTEQALRRHGAYSTGKKCFGPLTCENTCSLVPRSGERCLRGSRTLGGIPGDPVASGVVTNYGGMKTFHMLGLHAENLPKARQAPVVRSEQKV